jgi:hypothetical protein
MNCFHYHSVEETDYILLGITDFLDFVHHPVLQRTKHFGYWICFRPRMRGWEEPPMLGPLEGANHNYWTYNYVIALCRGTGKKNLNL